MSLLFFKKVKLSLVVVYAVYCTILHFVGIVYYKHCSFVFQVYCANLESEPNCLQKQVAAQQGQDLFDFKIVWQSPTLGVRWQNISLYVSTMPPHYSRSSLDGKDVFCTNQ